MSVFINSISQHSITLALNKDGLLVRRIPYMGNPDVVSNKAINLVERTDKQPKLGAFAPAEDMNKADIRGSKDHSLTYNN